MRSTDRCNEHKVSSPDKPFADRMASTPVNLSWLCHIVWRRWPIILGLCILGGLCGIIIAFVYPKHWTAIGLIEIGKVSDELLVSTPYTIDRLRDPAFSEKLLEHLKKTETEEFVRHVKRSIANLSVRRLRASRLIEVKIDGPSPEIARKLATSIFYFLRKIHLKKYDILVDSLRFRYEKVENNISKIEAEQAILRQLKKTIAVSAEEEGLTEKVLLMSLMAGNETLLRQLNKELSDLQGDLLPVRTFNTKLVTSIYVTETPTSPSIPIFVAVGALVTLFLALVWLVISRPKSESA
jgi:uncharacterized protein involved in exopolysaccharide biosynthesis